MLKYQVKFNVKNSSNVMYSPYKDSLKTANRRCRVLTERNYDACVIVWDKSNKSK